MLTTENHLRSNVSTALGKGATMRLTAFSHGGGCGCKIAPNVLADILRTTGGYPLPPQLLVGVETGDDAAIYQIDDKTAVVATTDFFLPIVDDPFDFGRIAATNAISDVYAMGGTPIMALALVGMPVDRLPVEDIRRILQGGEAACAEVAIPIAGGHTIDSVEPLYGLVVLGLVDPRKIKRNSAGRAGDILVLGKALGVGVLSSALRKGRLEAAGYEALIASTTKLNTPGRSLADRDDVHALTDVTGFGLLGHLLEICQGAQLAASIVFDAVPLLPGVRALAAEGFQTGASSRNWASYGNRVRLAPRLTDVDRAILTDPQTSGGLLVACAPREIDDVLAIFHRDGFEKVAVIGGLAAGEPSVTVV